MRLGKRVSLARSAGLRTPYLQFAMVACNSLPRMDPASAVDALSTRHTHSSRAALLAKEAMVEPSCDRQGGMQRYCRGQTEYASARCIGMCILRFWRVRKAGNTDGRSVRWRLSQQHIRFRSVCTHLMPTARKVFIKIGVCFLSRMQWHLYVMQCSKRMLLLGLVDCRSRHPYSVDSRNVTWWVMP
jgi:hypothetical protein